MYRLFGFKEVGGSEDVGSKFFPFWKMRICVYLFWCLVGSWEVEVESYIVFFSVWLVMWKWKWKS